MSPDVLSESIGLFSDIFSQFVVAIIILLVGFIVGRIVGRLLQKLLHEIELNQILKKATRMKIAAEEISGNVVSYFIYFVAIVMALSHLGLTTIVLHMIVAAVIILILVSLVLGIKDFIPNILAGIFIYRKSLVQEKDRIKVRNVEGTVLHVGLVETKIKTKNGDLIFIPNSMLTKNEVVKKR